MAAPVAAAGAAGVAGSGGAAAGGGAGAGGAAGGGQAAGAGPAAQGSGGRVPGELRRRLGRRAAREGIDAGLNPERAIKAMLAVLAPLFLLFLVILLPIVLLAAIVQAANPWGDRPPPGAGIPEDYWPMYTAAAGQSKVNPYLLASIHDHESDFGRSRLEGVTSGANGCGAAGPMQFGVVGVPPYDAPVTDCEGSPTTGAGPTWRGHWKAFAPIDAQRPDSYPLEREQMPACADVSDDVGCVYDSFDAIAAAAHKLSADGADTSLHSSGTLEAVEAYNGDLSYVMSVLELARKWEEMGVALTPLPGGAIRVEEPKRDQTIPSKYMAGGQTDGNQIDARIWQNVKWLLDTYDLVVTDGKDTGHRSHGDGSAIDAVPATGGSLSEWRRTAERAARVLGWTPACGSAGVAPACPLHPAIRFIGYNGYKGHGDPEHAGSNAHLHVSWHSSTGGTSDLAMPEWLLVFRTPATSARKPGEESN